MAGERRLVRGAAVMFTASSAARLLALCRGVVLAWLLNPDDFGIFSLGVVVTGFATLVGDVGAGSFLIYQKQIDEDADTAFWLNASVASVLAIIIILSASSVAAAFSEPRAAPVLKVLAVCLWLDLLASVPRNILRQRLQFGALAMIDASTAAVLLVMGVALAVAGWGVWALVVSTLVAQLSTLIMLHHLSRWLPVRFGTRASFSRIRAFAFWYLASALVWYAVLNLDKLLIGRYLGMHALGYYTVAYTYASIPLTIVGISLGQVVFPELARLHGDPDAFWKLYAKIARLMVASVSALCAVLVILAPDLFTMLLGASWSPARPVFQVLLIYMTLRCIWPDPFAALGRFRAAFWHGMGTLVITAVGIRVAAPYGIVAVAAAVLAIVGCSHVLALWTASGSIWRLGWGATIASRYLAMFVVLAGVGVMTRWFLEEAGYGGVTTTIACIVVPMPVLAGYFTVFRGEISQAVALMRVALPARRTRTLEAP
jgi:PST family polysaccharide transporter